MNFLTTFLLFRNWAKPLKPQKCIVDVAITTPVPYSHSILNNWKAKHFKRKQRNNKLSAKLCSDSKRIWLYRVIFPRSSLCLHLSIQSQTVFSNKSNREKHNKQKLREQYPSSNYKVQISTKCEYRYFHLDRRKKNGTVNDWKKTFVNILFFWFCVSFEVWYSN